MGTSLYLKSRLVNSPLEGFAKSIQQALKFPRRLQHPELGELFLEDRRVPDVLAKLLAKSSNAVDVGCHLGGFLSEVRRLAPTGKHVAIEASPSKARWLTQKFSDVRVEQVAISDAPGTATFEENLNNPGFSRLQSGRPSTELVHRYDVNVTTIDALNVPGRVDLLKVDIEGHELAALRGGVDLIARDRPAIIFECGSEPSTNVGSTRYQHPGLDRRQLFEFVTEGLGYEVMTFTDFLFNKGPLSYDEFRKCGIYPFRAFNYVALPRS